MNDHMSDAPFMKRMMPKTLLARALLIMILPIVLIQIITAVVFFDRHWTKMTHRLAFAVAGEIALVSDYVDNNVKKRSFDANRLALDVRKSLDLDIVFIPDATDMTISKESKGYVSSFWAHIVSGILEHELEIVLDYPFQVYAEIDQKQLHVSVMLKAGVLDVTLPGRRIYSSSGYIFLLWVVGSSILLMMISVLFMRNQIRPIRRLAVASERFGKGQEILGFKPQGAIEVRRAGEAFLLMPKRIQRQLSQRTAMLAGISHDLRTPLTRLKLQLAMMGSDDKDIAAMKADIADMEVMIGGYIDFVRGEGDETPSETDLLALIEKISKAALRSFEGANIYADLPDDLPGMILKENAFGRCLSNVIENALRYGENAWIYAQTKDGKLDLRIEDAGPGVEEEHFDDVFKPFFRVDSSRSSETGGVGLGMSVAMDIVHGHGGKIWLERSDRHGGLCVCIRLPL